jgi:hypothetical protein
MDPPHSSGAPFSFQLIKSCDAAETTLSLPQYLKAPFLFLWGPSPVPSTPFLQIGGSLYFSFDTSPSKSTNATLTLTPPPPYPMDMHALQKNKKKLRSFYYYYYF